MLLKKGVFNVKICVYGAASAAIDEIYVKLGEELGEKMAKRGHALVFGGGNNGMMGAVASGVKENGGYVCRIAPTFFDVDGALFEDCDEIYSPHTMRERKQMLDEMSEAFIVTPGGIGTYEEFFEILSSKQLGRHGKAIALLDAEGYFEKFGELIDHLVEHSFIVPEVKSFYKVFTSVDDLLDYIEGYVPKIVNPSYTRHINEMLEK